LIQSSHRHRCEYGAGGDQGVKLGHRGALEFGVSDQATICAAWFSAA
jgi:hypothetical protein